MLSFEQALIETAARLETSGSETPKLDALLLLCEAVAKDKIHVYAHPKTLFTQEQYAHFDALVARREKAEPMAYILGRKGFWDIDLDVCKDVLIPRPDTETLIEAILMLYPNKDQNLHFLELGVGSGAVILSLLGVYAQAQAWATDISDAALKCASGNAGKLQLNARLKLLKSNWFNAIEPTQQFDVILSNPPYIPSADIPNLMRDVGLYEPHQALDGGINGLDAYHEIINKAPQYLNKDGLLVLEVGCGQAEDVMEIMGCNNAFSSPDYKKDLAGIKRVVFARAN